MISRSTVGRLALLCALVFLGSSGCDRKPRLVPASADSTAAVSADSFAVYAQQARELWDAPDRGGDAAQLTARLVLDDLRRHAGAGLARRARTTIDSLGLGAEIAGGAEVAAINFFPRANPSGDSYPYFFWREDSVVRAQGVEGGGLRLLDLAVGPTGASASSPPGGAEDGAAPAQIALLFARATATGQQPLAFVWQRRPDAPSWALIQSLGPDSLGGVGTARFLSPNEDSIRLVTRTFQPTPRFDECASCPHVYRQKRFRWTAEGFVSAGEATEPSPYYAFVQFVTAIALGDRDMAQEYVSDPSLVDAAQGYQWGAGRALWRLAPGVEGTGSQMVFFRGSAEAYRVYFSRRGGGWVITSIQPTSRAIE